MPILQKKIMPPLSTEQKQVESANMVADCTLNLSACLAMTGEAVVRWIYSNPHQLTPEQVFEKIGDAEAVKIVVSHVLMRFMQEIDTPSESAGTVPGRSPLPNGLTLDLIDQNEKAVDFDAAVLKIAIGVSALLSAKRVRINRPSPQVQ